MSKGGFPQCITLRISSDELAPVHHGKGLVRGNTDGTLINAQRIGINWNSGDGLLSCNCVFVIMFITLMGGLVPGDFSCCVDAHNVVNGFESEILVISEFSRCSMFIHYFCTLIYINKSFVIVNKTNVLFYALHFIQQLSFATPSFFCKRLTITSVEANHYHRVFVSIALNQLLSLSIATTLWGFVDWRTII